MSNEVARLASQLENWLSQEALPYWAETGTDLVHGGFFERISIDGSVIDDPRRARVVTRQIYVFSTALRHGWIDSAADRISHGLDFLLSNMRLPSGLFAASSKVDGTPVNREFDLYEHAFVLFALAAAYRAQPERATLPGLALELYGKICSGWGHPEAGFFASGPPMPTELLANPHMHMFEAALVWAELGEPSSHASFHGLAGRLAELCLERLIDARTGAVHEYFDTSWRPLPGPKGRIVEPGHQFEWAWLLMRWGAAEGRQDSLMAARRLATVGEVHGVDPARGVALNELDSDLVVTDPCAKVWPQTERIKAWCAIGEAALTSAQSEDAQAKLVSALKGLLAYTTDAPHGRWHEALKGDGSFTDEATRASSLYHIVCAIDTLKSFVGRTSRAL